MSDLTRFREVDAETFEAARSKVIQAVRERAPLTEAELAAGWREDPAGSGLRRNVLTGEWRRRLLCSRVAEAAVTCRVRSRALLAVVRVCVQEERCIAGKKTEHAGQCLNAVPRPATVPKRPVSLCLVFWGGLSRQRDKSRPGVCHSHSKPDLPRLAGV